MRERGGDTVTSAYSSPLLPPFLSPSLSLLLSSVHENLFIKIADRGLSWDHYPEDYCNVDQKEGREMIALPIRWMAAEVIAERKYSHYSDVVRKRVWSGVWSWKWP